MRNYTKRIISLLVLVCMMCTILSGCKDKGKDGEPSDGADSSPSATEQAATPVNFDFAASSKFLNDDEVIMTVNGLEVKWKEYFYWLVSGVEYLGGYAPTGDWDAELDSIINESGKTTVEDAVKFVADDRVKYLRTIETIAKEMGIEITDEDKARFRQEYIDNYGSEEEFLKRVEADFLSEEILLYMSALSEMSQKAFEMKYGANGADVDDEVVNKYVEENNIFQAKHILFKTVDDEGKAISDDEIAAKRSEAEQVSQLLKEYSGDNFAEYFQTLSDEKNEDPGQNNYPEGYIFGKGTMVEAFENAVAELNENEVSGVVESSYGFHVIVRLPLNLDGVPLGASQENTVRRTAAMADFQQFISDRQKDAVVEFKDVYKTIVPSKVFIEAEKADDSAESPAAGDGASATDNKGDTANAGKDDAKDTGDSKN